MRTVKFSFAPGGAAVFLLLLSLNLTVIVVNSDVVVPVDIDYDKAIAHTSEGFLSVTFDTGVIVSNFRGLNLTSEKMINIGKSLAPAVLRLGGSSEDTITYDMSAGGGSGAASRSANEAGSHDEVVPPPSFGMDRLYAGGPSTMTRQQWDYINTYAETVGMSLIFGLNAQQRNKDGSWNSSNAKTLIDYTKSRGYKTNYELGNEPDLYFEHSDKINISGWQMADDFQSLAAYLDDSGLTKKVIAGPDVATLSRGHFFEQFLEGVKGKSTPQVVTWHQYYGDGRTFTFEDFHSATVLDKLMNELDLVQLTLKNTDRAKAEVWLGETSSTYGGGTPGISDSFIAGFMWLDKLGLTALFNYSHICRQTLWGGSYSLIDSKTMKPLPDFFASVGYKQLMGDRVLSVEGQMKGGRTTRVYAHCTRILPGSEFHPGAVTLMAMNIDNTTSAQMRLASRFDHTVVAQYLFQSIDGNPTSQTVLLNRNPLSLINDKEVPMLRPKLVVIPTEGTIQVPPLSYAFFVLPTANATACL